MEQPDRTTPGSGRHGKRVLLIDPGYKSGRMLVQSLVDLGFDVVQAWSAEQGISMYRCLCHVVDLVLLNMDLPDRSGPAVFEWLQHINSNVRVVLLTEGLARDPRLDKALGQGALGTMCLQHGAVRMPDSCLPAQLNPHAAW